MAAEITMFVVSSLLFRKLMVKNLSNSNAFLSSASTTMSLADFRKEYSRTALVLFWRMSYAFPTKVVFFSLWR
jgi:hypothetical protein